MSTFPRSPRVVKGGLVLLHPGTGEVLRVITLQFNPDSLNRSLQPQGAGGGQDAGEALRLVGPPVETLSFEAELDATEQLEFPESNVSVAEVGLARQLAALEVIAYPPSQRLIDNDELASAGSIEILPAGPPLLVLVWSSHRVVPVRITDFSIVEEAFDTALQPIRAKVSLSVRVLSVNDLPFQSKGGSLYLVHQQQKETLARGARYGVLRDLGIGEIG